MDVWVVLGEFSFLLLICFFLVFSLYSLIEREKRAFWRSALFLVGLSLVNFVFRLVADRLQTWLFGAVFILFVVALFLLFMPSLKKTSTELKGKQEKIDERDVIFARFDLEEGSRNYESGRFYSAISL